MSIRDSLLPKSLSSNVICPLQEGAVQSNTLSSMAARGGTTSSAFGLPSTAEEEAPSEQPAPVEEEAPAAQPATPPAPPSPPKPAAPLIDLLSWDEPGGWEWGWEWVGVGVGGVRGGGGRLH